MRAVVGLNATPLAPKKVLAWSEARVDEPPGDKPVVALWLPAGTTVALGLSQRAEVELDVQAVRRDGVNLVRRQSGGGAVLLYPGVLCWEAWTPFDIMEQREAGSSGIRESYRFLCRPAMAGLQRLGIDVFQAGICDLSTPTAGGGARKLAGTAQLRRRRQVLVHGSLLVDPDLSLLGRYLRQPSVEPDYRDGRAHGDFCVSVAELIDPTPRGPMPRVAEAIIGAALDEGWDVVLPPVELDPAAAAIHDAKYSRDTWNWEKIRTP